MNAISAHMYRDTFCGSDGGSAEQAERGMENCDAGAPFAPLVSGVEAH